MAHRTGPTSIISAKLGAGVGLLLLMLIATGCRPRGETAPANTLYTGPTEPMADVVAQINRNNAALPTIWARHYFEANIVDENKVNRFANGDGVLLYKSPRGMRLVGTKPGAGTVFEIGSTDDRYWLSLNVDQDTMWWGWYRNLNKPCVDARAIPVRPDLVLEVLGVNTIDTDFLQAPAPTMRFNNDADAYMFVWNAPAGDRWAAQKEIWYDRATKEPRRVMLFDENGRVVLSAKLMRHAPVELEGVAQENWPKVARLFELYFPDTGSKMRFELDEVALDKRSRAGLVPTETGIAFPEDPKVDQVIQLDKDCAD